MIREVGLLHSFVKVGRDETEFSFITSNRGTVERQCNLVCSKLWAALTLNHLCAYNLRCMPARLRLECVILSPDLLAQFFDYSFVSKTFLQHLRWCKRRSSHSVASCSWASTVRSLLHIHIWAWQFAVQERGVLWVSSAVSVRPCVSCCNLQTN